MDRRALIAPGLAGLACAAAGLGWFDSTALADEAAAYDFGEVGAGAVPAAASGETLSYGLATVPFFVRDMLLLRTLAIGAALLAIVLNLARPGGRNWVVIVAMSVVIVTNAVRILHLVVERCRVSFSDEERELFQTVFRAFTAVEFMRLLRLGRRCTATPGEAMALQGQALDDLMLIIDGEVAVEREGREVARARRGALIGELSYLQGGDATATVRAVRPTRYLAWRRDKLGKLLRRNPTMNLALKSVLNADLVHKLQHPALAPAREPVPGAVQYSL